MSVFKSKQPFNLPPHFSVNTDVENRIHQTEGMQSIFFLHCIIIISSHPKVLKYEVQQENERYAFHWEKARVTILQRMIPFLSLQF